MERIEDVMKYPTDPALEAADDSAEYSKLSGAVELRHVTFGYSRLAMVPSSVANCIPMVGSLN